MKKSTSPSGVVLVIVLWVLAMLSAIGLGLSYRTGLQTKRVGWSSGKVQSVALCQAGLQRMLFELDKEDSSYDALTDTWSNSSDLFDRFRLQGGVFTIRYRRDNPENPAKPMFFFGASDEESLIPVNTAPREVLERLFKNVGVSPDLYDAIADWIDADSGARFHGAEAPDYLALEHPYQPRNDKLQMLEELLLVKGMTPEIFSAIAPYLTVHTDGKVNINTASGPVLEALGMPSDLVEKILRYRRGVDNLEGTDDDGVFRDITHCIDNLASTESVGNSERTVIINLTGLLTVRSRFFRMHVQGDASGGVSTRVNCVVERFDKSQGLPARVRSWKEE